MVQLNVLSGKMAGTSRVTRHFPVRIGRSPSSDLRLEEDGIWEEHLLLALDRQGFSMKVQSDALASVNGQALREAYLRNGDTIELGSVRLQFWLSRVRQGNLRFAEGLAWISIVAVVAGQVGLLYWLLR
jgi:pSer/pThr/pTyr-binding forkhead associated (FHA) protein